MFYYYFYYKRRRRMETYLKTLKAFPDALKNHFHDRYHKKYDWFFQDNLLFHIRSIIPAMTLYHIKHHCNFPQETIQRIKDELYSLSPEHERNYQHYHDWIKKETKKYFHHRSQPSNIKEFYSQIAGKYICLHFFLSDEDNEIRFKFNTTLYELVGAYTISYLEEVTGARNVMWYCLIKR